MHLVIGTCDIKTELAVPDVIPFASWHHSWKFGLGFLLAGVKTCICEIHKALLEVHGSCDLECLVTSFQELLDEGRIVCLRLLRTFLKVPQAICQCADAGCVYCPVF